MAKYFLKEFLLPHWVELLVANYQLVEVEFRMFWYILNTCPFYITPCFVSASVDI
jgi:hypothetical protein